MLKPTPALLVACLLGGCLRPAPPSPAPPVPTATVQAAPESSETPATEKRQVPGTRELVKELEEYERIHDPMERWFKRQQTLLKIHELGDPRGADALHAYLERAQKFPRASERVHVRTEIAIALAEIGDPRAVPVLAERLGLDPSTVYAEEIDYEAALRRTDQERVVSARLIGDLAVLHPEQRDGIRKQAEQAVWTWISSSPMPHANGLRALSRMRSEHAPFRAQLRKWADPRAALPKPGQQPPFPAEFEVAQSSLRYLGAIGDDKAFGILEKQLKRRPKTFDATMEGMVQTGGALLGMTLRALEIGAAQGFSELGDHKAFSALSKLVLDDKENEQARVAACHALAWVADDGDAKEIAKRIEAWRAAADKPTRFRVGCLLEALEERPLGPVRPVLLGIVENGPIEIRQSAARALGKAGFDEAVESKLVALLGDPAAGSAAALALLLGGSVGAAKRVIEAFPKSSDLGDGYRRSFASVSQEDLDQGRFFRWVNNAMAAGPGWPRDGLRQELGNIVYDAGPHSLTRVVLRRKLFDLARGAGPAEKKSATTALELMNERGVLLALDDGA
jgi:HEAT repeat protein